MSQVAPKHRAKDTKFGISGLCLYHDDHNQLELPSVKLTFQPANTFGNLPLVPVQLSIRNSNIIN